MQTISRNTDGMLDPPRMTVKWLQRQTDEHLAALKERWPLCCCRGRMIWREIERREIQRESPGSSNG